MSEDKTENIVEDISSDNLSETEEIGDLSLIHI